MSKIVERIQDAIWAHDNDTPPSSGAVCAALASIRAEDVSDEMCRAMASEVWGTLMRDGKAVPDAINPETLVIFRRALAAAIAAGGE